MEKVSHRPHSFLWNYFNINETVKSKPQTEEEDEEAELEKLRAEMAMG